MKGYSFLNVIASYKCWQSTHEMLDMVSGASILGSGFGLCCWIRFRAMFTGTLSPRFRWHVSKYEESTEQAVSEKTVYKSDEPTWVFHIVRSRPVKPYDQIHLRSHRWIPSHTDLDVVVKTPSSNGIPCCGRVSKQRPVVSLSRCSCL